MILHFEFYRDEKGRLRCLLRELGIRKPVETADGQKRYKIAKVMGLYGPVLGRITEKDLLRLQTAQEGEIVEVEI